MSEDEHRRANEEETDEADTEAHRRALAANVEAGDEAEGDDVEAHRRANA